MKFFTGKKNIISCAKMNNKGTNCSIFVSPEAAASTESLWGKNEKWHLFYVQGHGLHLPH